MIFDSIILFVQQTNLSEQAATIAEQVAKEESYFNIVIKGGWILVPLFLMSLISIYVMIERWIEVSRAGKKGNNWLAHTSELIHDRKIDKALYFCMESPSPSAKITAAGLKEIDDDIENIQESMQVESRQQVALLENQMNYLGIISSVAPMLGFLGTIFGVIKIFYNISVTNNLDISTISDGLYQKMICSGVGLFVGIIAYSAYYLLNGKIDKVIAQMDRDSNDVLRVIRQYKSEKQ